MRVLILSAALLTFGCDDNNLNNNGNNDLSAPNNNSDMPAMVDGATGAMCDLLAQDCPTGQKCALVGGGGGGGGGATPVCVTAGTVTEGMTCMRGMMGSADNCAAGLTCSRTGVVSTGGGMTAGSVCRKICADDSTCTNGQRCAILSFNTTDVGQCIPTCKPFSNDCGTNATCSNFTDEVGSTQTTGIALMVCRAIGMGGTVFGDCMRQSDCPENTYCDSTMTCMPLCDTSGSHECPPGIDGGTFTCTSIGTDLTSDPGVCQ